MRIRYETIPEMTTDEFADKYGLEMVVRERRPELLSYSHIGPGGRYYASFEKVEIRDNGCLRGVSGNGSTPEEAIDNYIDKITGVELVYRAMSDDRIDIPPTHIRRQ